MQKADGRELRLLFLRDPDSNETYRNNLNEEVRENNNKVIGIYKEAVAAMKAWVEKVEEAKKDELKKTKEPEKTKIDEPNAELNKMIEGYNREVEAHEKEYKEWRDKLFKDIIFYKYGKRDGDTNEVLVSPPDRAGFEEIEELMKKVEPLKHIFPNTPNKDFRYDEFNEQQLKIREEVITKIKAYLDKNQQAAEGVDKKVEEILNNKSGNQENDNDNKDNNSSESLFKFQENAINEISKAFKESEPSLEISFNDIVSEIMNAKSKEEVNEVKEATLRAIEIVTKREEQKEKSDTELCEILNWAFVDKFSPEEAKECIEKIEKFNGKISYKERLDSVETNKRMAAGKLGMAEYTKLLIGIINNRLKEFNLKPEELGTEIQQKLTNLTQQTDFEEANELEKKINQKINEVEADRKFKQIEERANRCSSEKEKAEIEKEINDFITSDKVYYQKKVEKARQMLEKLKVNSNASQPQPSNNFPWKVVVPVALLSVILVGGIIIAKRKGLKKKVR